MESPPSYSAQSDAPQLSDDSGLLVTSGSFSSDSASGWPQISLELQESDYDDRSWSLCESAETSERMCGGHFNTVKKGPSKITITAIEPPPQFQDHPPIIKENIHNDLTLIEDDELPPDIILKVEMVTLQVPLLEKNSMPTYSKQLKCESLYERRQCLNQRYTSPRLLHLSPCRGARPASRCSLSSRLSSSHNSLVTQLPSDDSSFITQAISHDALTAVATANHIPDMYTVPFDSDIYAYPVDMLHPTAPNRHRGKKPQKNNRKRGKSMCQATASNSYIAPDKNPKFAKESRNTRAEQDTSKRNSLPGPSVNSTTGTEPMHMTLREVPKYLHTLYSSSSDTESRNNVPVNGNDFVHNTNKDVVNRIAENCDSACKAIESNNNHRKTKKHNFVNNIKSKKHKDCRKDVMDDIKIKKTDTKQVKPRNSPVKMLSINLKQTFCNLFRLKRSSQLAEVVHSDSGGEEAASARGEGTALAPVLRRALPPLPRGSNATRKVNDDEAVTDFATSIEKVKDYGWYWGPISVEGAEKILSNEPDGSFIVRDSSDHHYIFTLTFKLNGLRHVRIEHEQGNFCFGGCTMFKAATIVEFIENAVETSRSGRYLFFLNLRPVLGPVRVQLLYPVSRFRRVQSLQHMCRFVILKFVRRDLISSLPLPRRLLDYLSATHYFSELLADP